MLKLSLFGNPRCQQDGQIVHLPRRKCLALLAYLALNSQPHSREALATLLYPDSANALTYLRRTLSEIRKSVDDDLLLTAGEVRLAENGLWVDVLEFEKLVRLEDDSPADEHMIVSWQTAVSLYTADFMTGFTLPDAPEFDEWQFFQTESLRQTFASVLRKLIAWHTSRREFEQSIAYGRRWLALDPLHEPAHRELMRLYADAGQQAAALRQYDECVRLLHEELGITPAEATKAVYETIRTRQPSSNEPSPSLSYASAPLHNFPSQTTAFIGRQEEIIEISQVLGSDPDCRLFTIVGQGGVGKTRLALEVGQRVLSAFPQGARLVSLAAINSLDYLAPAIAAALDLKLAGRQSPREQLFNYLKRQHLLLILDSFEQLIAGVELLTDILLAAPQVKLLVTSRERLHVQPEWVYDLAGLTYPNQHASSESMDVLMETYSALALFVQRAQQARATFRPSLQNWPAILHICRLVEGMPLGVELAASWIPVLSCQEIAAGIAHNLDFLTTTLRDIPGRHRSLRAVFQHSWSLLTADEQAVLRQLSVFRGGFTRDAAEQVTGTVLLPLAGLVRKSLVTRESNGRYTIHELLRQFANERLAESGEEEQAQQHHLNYFVQYAEKVEPELFGPEQAVWLKQLQRDHNNFQAAIECTLKSAHTETGLRLASALGTFWMVRGHVSEGRRILSKLLALSETGLPNLLVAKAHIEAATLANAQGDQIGAEMWFQKSFEGYRQLDDKRGMARAFNGLGNVAWMKGDFKRAHNYYSESLSLYRELDDEDGIAGALNMLGLVALEQGELVQAFTQLDQSLALHRKQGNLRGMATILNNLGNVSEDPVQAATYYQESLILCGALGDMVNSAETLEGLAGVAQRCDQTVPAARLLGAVVAFRSLLDVAQPIQDQIDHQNLIAAIRSQLSETRFEAAWAEGQTMTLEQAVDYGLQVSGVLSASGQPKN